MDSATRKQRLVRLAVALAISAACIAGVVVYLTVFYDNFHPVIEGKVYRSAQLDFDGFVHRITNHGIRSVLNLRGLHPGSEWYDAETNACVQLGVAHYSVSLSARREPSDDTLTNIVALLRQAPKPVLIHCARGADRTSLVAAMYMRMFEGHNDDQARDQISWRFGHITLLAPATLAMDRSFDRFCTHEFFTNVLATAE